MNILLFDSKDLRPDNTIEISGDKALHIIKVLKLSKNDSIKTGEINGKTGISKILSIKDNKVLLKPCHDKDPAPAIETTLVTALPRPKAARRIIYSAALLGVKKIYLINSSKVEKSYWQSPLIDEPEIEKQLINALEQSVDTVMPQVIKKNLFKPFCEDELPRIIKNSKGYLLDPYSSVPFPREPEKTHSIVIIGPDGGFTDYENKKIIEAGAKPYFMGKRILKVETSVVAAISKFIY
ncbi:MAG: 16S rRNA (uracil(1498)-N(3))-methyltransferase [Desulfobacteraceae bacterium]|nr:16S rRNA (uracil(1498)-N(3))-methyltransferase [Desulfobacteraceae bacterium]MCB9494246.1 16S rRNA (uracil(1498)-N(3))-methyltransferase [Desulfobacteraceae bacterium]